MKKLTAKICIWVLGKLGYENNYSFHQTHTIMIDIDAKEALSRINQLAKATQKLSNELKGIKEIQTDIHGL